jgi:alpha-1,6-mannosyltransferase
MVVCDINIFLSPKGGGIKTYHVRKAQWYADSCPDDRYVTIQPARGMGVKMGPAPNILHLKLPGSKAGGNYRFFLSYKNVRNTVKALAVDVLEAGDPYLTARFGTRAPAKVRTSFWHSDPETAYFDLWARQQGPASWRHLAAKFAASWVNRQQKGFDLVWCASDWAAGHLRSRGVANVEVLPFGTDKGTFRPEARDREWLRRFGLDPDRPVILYAGRLDREKGITTLIDAVDGLLALPQKPQVVVSGRGYYSEHFESLERPGYRYIGYLNQREDMARLYASCDLLVATCSVETFGLAILEALTSGLPALSADDGGGAEIVRKSGAGALFKAGDGGDLVRQAGQFLSHAPGFRGRAAEFGAGWPSWDDFFSGQHGRTAELLRERA